MHIPDEVRKCVVFLGAEDKSAEGQYVLLGSAFIVSQAVEGTDGKKVMMYLVTAAHTMTKAIENGVERIYIRVNLKNGASRWELTEFADWVYHRDGLKVDVAVRPMLWDVEYDHLSIPENLIIDKTVIEDGRIGIGQEVFITGLFSQHSGTFKNIPIVRVGNIAALDEEPVWTDDLGRIDAYLIEARSIGGLSGSPVFAYFGAMDLRGGNVAFRPGALFSLLGLIHGHYDIDESKIDADSRASRKAAQVNMGIAIVVPWYKILEVVKRPKLLQITAELQARKEAERIKLRTDEQVVSIGKAFAAPVVFSPLSKLSLPQEAPTHEIASGAQPVDHIGLDAVQVAQPPSLSALPFVKDPEVSTTLDTDAPSPPKPINPPL